MSTMPQADGTRIPQVGVGCIVLRDGNLLMVKSHSGYWSTPGGHLDFGESPEQCAVRETEEETGVRVTNVEFVAITNDVIAESGIHYVAIWMRAHADDSVAMVGDSAEIAEVGWFSLDALPVPLFLWFENLMTGRCMPAQPANLPVLLAQVCNF